MALDSPEAYERLGEHLKEIDSIFQGFLESSGYSNNTGALGRYPHRSAVLETDVNRKIDLQMDHDSDGDCFSEFEPSIPYTLWAGAWVDTGGRRYCPDRGVLIFENLPFVEMVPKLARFLKEAELALGSYTKAEIVAQSESFGLPRSEPQR